MTVLASDPFTGTGNTPLSAATWKAGQAPHQIPVLLSNEAYSNGPNIAVGVYIGIPSWPNDGYAELVVGSVLSTTSDEGVGPAFRQHDPAVDGGMYLAQTNTHETRLYVTPSGSSFTQLGNDAAPCVSGDRLRIICRGNQISATINGVLVIGPVTDDNITAGNAGVWMTPAGAGTAASWEAGNLLGPTITVQPGDVTVPAGAGATFTVTAQVSNGSLSYQWQDDSAAQGQAIFANIAAANTASLSVGIVSGDMSGRHYRVLVTDSDGTVTSNIATLRVLVNAPTPSASNTAPWSPRDNLSARVWSPLLDVRAWLPTPAALQIQKWFFDWLEVPPAPGAITINCTVASLQLGNVKANVSGTLNLNARPGALTLGSVNARVQLATAINTTRGQLTLGSVQARIQLATAINAVKSTLNLNGTHAAVIQTTVIACHVGGLTLGSVSARVQLATAVNAAKSTLNLGGVQAAVQTSAQTTINGVRGQLTLAGVRAAITSTTGIGAVPAALTLGGVQAKVIQTTVIGCRVGGLTLGAVPAQVYRSTPVNAGQGSLTLGRVNAKVQLATAVNTAPAVLQLRGTPATVRVVETTRINCSVGGLTLAGTHAQIVAGPPPVPEPPRTFGGGGGPGGGYVVTRRVRVRVSVADQLDDRLIIVARTTPYIRPLATQIAAIVEQAREAMTVVQRAHWAPKRAQISAMDTVSDDVLAKVSVTDIDLQRFHDALVAMEMED